MHDNWQKPGMMLIMNKTGMIWRIINIQKHKQKQNREFQIITQTSCKIMERMATERLTYFLESKDLLTPFQSGIHRGRNKMDSVLCFESDIRKARTNKEVVIAVVA